MSRKGISGQGLPPDDGESTPEKIARVEARLAELRAGATPRPPLDPMERRLVAAMERNAEMLAALKLAIEDLEGLYPNCIGCLDGECWHAKARAAVAKAEGRDV